MMRVWSHRPQFLHLGLFIAAYVLGCGFAQFARHRARHRHFHLASERALHRDARPRPQAKLALWVLGGGVAELIGNVLWFHSPVPAAWLIFSGNALEAVVGAWLVNRTGKRPVRLETLQEVLTFVVLAAGVAPS